MTENRVYNFAAGPSVMPEKVLHEAQRDMLNYKGTGMSVMEMTHRGKAFQAIHDDAKDRLRSLMSIPENYEILFLQGGATTQFASIPMNLLKTGSADYAITGNFSNKAAKECRKYGNVNVSFDGTAGGYRNIPKQEELKFSDNASYFYYCKNNTIYGTEWQYDPVAPSPIVCDMSSDILSRQVDVSKFGLIYAGAQKNMAPAGLTVVIVDKNLLGTPMPITPEIMDYNVLVKNDSMLNTPPCWCIYMLGLTLKWIQEEIGGVAQMEKLNIEKSNLLYSYLDQSRIFKPYAAKDSRSRMNITFRTGDDELDAAFIAQATKAGLHNVKAHRITGGMRASLYNAMPLDGVKALVTFMEKFEENNR